MLPFESLRAVSYSYPIVTMALLCMISEIMEYIDRESRLFSSSCIRRPRANTVITFHMEKVERQRSVQFLVNSPQKYGTPLVNGITQCYLPPTEVTAPPTP